LIGELDQYDGEYFAKRERAYVGVAVKRFAFEILLKAEGLLGLELTRSFGRRAIDIGCAQGYVVELLRRLGYKAHGIDVSYVIEKSKVKDALIKASWTHIAFKDESFDLVTAFEVIEHLPNHKAVLTALNETFRVLKGGGVFIFTTPTQNPIQTLSDRLHGEHHHILHHPSYWRTILGSLSTRVVVIPFLSVPFERFPILDKFYWIRLPSFFARHVTVLAMKDVE
jgi:SAM-dependent methyltransferase